MISNQKQTKRGQYNRQRGLVGIKNNQRVFFGLNSKKVRGKPVFLGDGREVSWPGNRMILESPPGY